MRKIATIARRRAEWVTPEIPSVRLGLPCGTHVRSSPALAVSSHLIFMHFCVIVSSSSILHPEYPAVSLRPFLQFLLDYDFWMWAAGVNLELLLPCASLLRIFPGLLLCSGSWFFFFFLSFSGVYFLQLIVFYASEFYNFPWAVDVLRSYIFELQFSCQSFYWRMPSWGWSCNLWCRGLTQASQCLLGAWRMLYLFFLAGSPSVVPALVSTCLAYVPCYGQ